MPDMYEFVVNEKEFVALINELLGKTTDNETADNNEADINTDNDTADILADDLFRAKNPNGLEDVYRAGEFNIGAVISINDVEHFHIASVHNDNTTFWVNAAGHILSEEDMAQYARGANSLHGAVVTEIVHFG